jgi:hypothetical protein
MDDRNLDRNHDAIDEKRLPRNGAPDDFEAHRLHGDVSDKRLSEPTAGRDEEADDFEGHAMKVLGTDKRMDADRRL